MTRDMTEGNPLRQMVAFMIPVLIGNLFQQFYNIVDSVIVGRFVGVQALAAVGSTGSLYFLVVGTITGLCSGFAIPIGNCFGARDDHSMQKYIANALYVSAAIAALLTPLALICCKNLLRMIDTPEDIFQDAYRYIFTIFAGIAVTIAYNLLANISRAMGDSRTPLLFLLVASALNIGLDLFFVLVLNLGTAGVAYATVLAQAIAAGCCLIYMIRKYPILSLPRSSLPLDRKMMWQLISMGVSIALQSSVVAVGLIIMQAAINSFGSAVVAAVTAASRVQTMLMQPFEALVTTVATFTSQNMGAGKMERIRSGIKQCLVLTVILCFILCAIGVLGGVSLCKLFVGSGETDLFPYIRQYMWYNCFFYWLVGILVVERSAIQGMGYALPMMAGGVIELLVRAVIALIFVKPLGYIAICIANPVAWGLATVIFVPMYLFLLKRHSLPANKICREPAGECV